MPISPEKMKRYPGGGIKSKVWLAFRADILARAEDKCEGTPQRPLCRAANGEAQPETGSRVVLTIAHMDWDETHADPARCRALCQRCHNKWDAPQRAKSAAATRRARQPQTDLEDYLSHA
jgi:hypothetical protein